MRDFTSKPRMGLFGSAAAGVLLLGLTSGSAEAASVSSQLFLGETNQFSDNSGESLNVSTASTPGGTPLLWIGSTLRGTFDIQTVEDLTGGGGTNSLGTAGVNELSGIFEVMVTSATVVSDPDASCGGDPTCGGGGLLSGDELADYAFGAYAPFVAAEAGGVAGAMVVFHEDAIPDYDRTLATQAAIEATAVDGPIVWILGIDGSDVDDRWLAFGAPVDPSVAGLVPVGTAIAVFNFQTSILFNALFADNVQILGGCNFPTPTNPACAGDGLVDVNASGQILGTLGSTSFYDVFNNVDITFRPVPEPATLGLVGIGLLGLGALSRRRRKA